MATNNFAACLAFTLDPAQDGQPLHVTPGDEGAATAWGITLATLSGYLRKPCVPDDLAAMTQDTIQAIYASSFWNPIRGDDLPLGIDLMVFDFGVTAGAHTSARMLQKALGLSGPDMDGWIGPQTLALAAARPVQGLILGLSIMQDLYYGSLASAVEFDRGWRARTGRRSTAALAMARGEAPVPAPVVAADDTADELNAAEETKVSDAS